MTGPRMKALWLAGLSAALIAALSGCDANENADLVNGRQLFITNCGTCHQLKEAGGGTDIGPDLDSAFADARASGMDQDTIEGVVESQIANPRQTDPENPTYMPAEIVSGQDAADVAAYVASVAGVPGIEAPQAPGGPGGQVFADNGCGTCHTLAAAETGGTTGPNLDETLPGQSEAQIERSIVDPSAEIVAGFADQMPPDYGESIPPEDLKLLVGLLADSAGKTPPADGGGN